MYMGCTSSRKLQYADMNNTIEMKLFNTGKLGKCIAVIHDIIWVAINYKDLFSDCNKFDNQFVFVKVPIKLELINMSSNVSIQNYVRSEIIEREVYVYLKYYNSDSNAYVGTILYDYRNISLNSQIMNRFNLYNNEIHLPMET